MPKTIETVASLTFYHWIIIEEFAGRTSRRTVLVITNASVAMLETRNGNEMAHREFHQHVSDPDALQHLVSSIR